MKTLQNHRLRSQSLSYTTIFLLFIIHVFNPATAGPGKGKKYKDWAPPEDEWLAYSIGKKGRMKPIELPIEANKDKDWVIVRYTDFQGPKPLVGISDVINKTSELSEGSGDGYSDGADSEVPVAGIGELMTSALSGSHRFSLVDRQSIEAVKKELNFSNSEYVNPKSAAQIGKLLGARYIIIVTVNEWTPNKKSMGAFGIGGKQIAEVAMSFKFLEVETGKVILALTERAKSGSWNIGLGVDPGSKGIVGMGGSSPINYAVSAAINKLTYRLCQFIKDVKWQGSVIVVKGQDQVYINGTSSDGLEVGQELDVFALGEGLIDPVTGEDLGSEEEKIGTLIVTQIKAKYAIATVKTGCRGIKREDRVRIAGTTSGGATF